MTSLWMGGNFRSLSTWDVLEEPDTGGVECWRKIAIGKKVSVDIRSLKCRRVRHDGLLIPVLIY